MVAGKLDGEVFVWVEICKDSCGDIVLECAMLWELYDPATGL